MDKSRGLEHIKNKRRYKGKSTKDPKYVPAKAKQNLESNWDRYEKEDAADVPQLNSSTDFSILASAPITHGHHFQFKSDKFLKEEMDDKLLNNFFSLDLNMLASSILTVPFYERIGIEGDCFMENQIKFMHREAADSLVEYNKKCCDNELLSQVKEEQIKPVGSNIVENIVENTIQSETCTEDVVSKENGMKQPTADVEGLSGNNSVEEDVEKEKSEDDLEQWLDDILDD